MLKSRMTGVWLVVAIGLGLSAGCKKTDPTSAPPNQQMDFGTAPQFDAESGPHAAGKKAMVASGCFRCHAVNGARASGAPGGPPGGMMGGRGPDLGKAGRDSEHTVAWLAEFIKNPRSKKPEARMPPQEGRLSDGDLKAIAEYLASLK